MEQISVVYSQDLSSSIRKEAMKIIVLLCSLQLVSFASYGQVKTGGGPDTTDYDLRQDRGPKQIQKLMNEFVDYIKKSDTKCTSRPRLKDDKNLMAIYLKLSLLKSAQLPPERCEEENRYLNCLNEGTARRIAKSIKEYSRGESYIADTFKIPQSEADKMLDFFINLGATEQ